MGPYRRLPATAGADATDAQGPVRRGGRELSERITNKVHATFWVVLALLVAHSTQLVPTALDGSKSHSVWIGLGLAAAIVNLAIMLYLICYLPRVRGIDLPWEIAAPQLIPAGTIAGGVSFVAFILGLWPAYGLLTPLICGAVGMGVLFSAHFIPL